VDWITSHRNKLVQVVWFHPFGAISASCELIVNTCFSPELNIKQNSTQGHCAL